MSSVQDAYEQVSYPCYVHPLTDPARLAALGRLLGLKAAQPNSARVLDIGCGSGTNLLAMAERLPGSQFLGIDFVAAEIESARALAAEAGLENVTFEQADLLRWEPGDETYDYIIAYGLFSWAPDDVKDRLFQVCRQSLAPHGLACISYLTYPGCKQPEAFRDLLRLRTESCGTPEERVAAAYQVLDFLERAYDRLPQYAHANHLREQVRQIRRKEPRFLLLDELGVERDPCYFLEFANWAADHQLRYVGESEFPMMFVENLPPESARELAAMDLDRLETEQMIDFVVNRSFRCSLLAIQDACGPCALDANALDELFVKPLLVPEATADWPPEEGRFRSQVGLGVTLRSEPLVAFLRVLAARPAAFAPFAEVLAAAAKLADRAFTPAEVARLREDLLALFVRRQLDLSALAFTPPAVLSLRPQLTPLNRAAVRRRSLVVTAFHEASRVTPAEQAFCELLDGARALGDLLGNSTSGLARERKKSLLAALRTAGCLA